MLDADERTVAVRVLADAARLDIQVGDSGPGVPPEAAALVFERGWSTKGGESGLGRGLGLALVGQVVRRYGGHVDVGESELGGALFHVRIGSPS